MVTDLNDGLTEHWTAILTSSPYGCVSFDRLGLVKLANPAFEQLTGISAISIIGKSESDLLSLLSKNLKGNTRLPHSYNFTSLHESYPDTNQQKRHIVELTGNPGRILEIQLCKPESAEVSQVLYFRDITHETTTNQAKSEFLATAAHELRTPMASIHGFTEVLLTQKLTDSEQQEFLEIIYKQSERIVLIINELLDLARIESHRGKDFIIKLINLADFLKDIVLGFKVPDGRIFPELIISNDPIWIQADPNKLTQALNNILSNAYNYSSGTQPIRIVLVKQKSHLNASTNFPRLGISITDCGIGMSDVEKAQIFNHFYRADHSGKIPGTGLGLTIVKEIIDLHGGEVTVDSRLGEGTTVTVWLPIVSTKPAVEEPIQPLSTIIRKEKS